MQILLSEQQYKRLLQELEEAKRHSKVSIQTFVAAKSLYALTAQITKLRQLLKLLQWSRLFSFSFFLFPFNVGVARSQRRTRPRS